jgi:hypothetical protein
LPIVVRFSELGIIWFKPMFPQSFYEPVNLMWLLASTIFLVEDLN